MNGDCEVCEKPGVELFELRVPGMPIMRAGRQCVRRELKAASEKRDIPMEIRSLMFLLATHTGDEKDREATERLLARRIEELRRMN